MSTDISKNRVARLSGFSLTEVMIVVAIMILLMGLLLPVLLKAKDSSQQTVCTSNLRQLHSAWSLYRSEFDEVYPIGFTNFIKNSQRDILKCNSDTLTPGANKSASLALGSRVSYFYLPVNQELRDQLLVTDPNHGIAYDVLHGSKTEDQVSDPRASTKGLVLRLRVDGSIGRVHVGYMCSDKTAEGFIKGRPDWLFFTNSGCPPKFCGQNVHPCE